MFVWHFFAGFARAILPARFVKWLRGDFKSVSGRLLNRWERVKLARIQSQGGTYLQWYARRLDDFAAHPRIDPKVKRSYHDSGVNDLETVKKLGLEKTHMLHEFGFGFLRSAYYFIDYLNPGNFSGNDISSERVRSGIDYIKNTYGFDIEAKQPLLIINKDNSFDWLTRKPDMIWCHAVFTHMPEDDIDEVIKNLHKVLKPGSGFYFTYSNKKGQRGSVERMGAQDWWHSPAFFDQLAAKHGLKITHLTDVLQALGTYQPVHHLGKMSLN